MPVAPESPEHIVGFLDDVTPYVIRGWASDLSSPEAPIARLFIDDIRVAEQRGHEHRPGVKAAGRHPSGNCGFRFELPPELRLKFGQTVRVLAGESRKELRGSPWHFGGPEAVATTGRVYFMHIAKTAGSTLNDFLASHYPKNRVRTHFENSNFREDCTFASRHDFLSGHVRLAESEARMDLGPFTWVTVLREPISHLGSHLCWVKSLGVDRGTAAFRKLPERVREIALSLQEVDFDSAASLERYLSNLEGSALNLFHDCQTRYLVGAGHRLALSTSNVAAAKHNLRRFHVVGITERFDPFLGAICKRMRWAAPVRSQRLNVQTQRFGLDLDSEATRAVFKRFVQSDIELYRLASELSP